MMKQNTIETVIGFAVLIAAITFISFAFNKSNINITDENYVVNALFDNAEGISEGSDVMIAGVKVGKVNKMTLNNSNYFAEVQLSINNDIAIPADSTAAIVSSGILGNKYVSITPGGEEKLLVNNDSFSFTQSSLNLESLINKFLLSDKK